MNLKGIKPINLENVKEPRINRILRVGVELEGGWDKRPGPHKIEHDGSVKGLVGVKLGVGEIPSPPLEPEAIGAWIREYYPPHINETCGMHVHFSFKTPMAYQRLMVPEYDATVIDAFNKWATNNLPIDHCIWTRLKGESPYCQHVFDADNQVLNNEKDRDQHRRGHRYTVINRCWSRIGTTECRLLPMMPTANLAVKAVEELMNITNKFFIATAKKEAKLRGEVEDKMKEIRENRQMRVRI